MDSKKRIIMFNNISFREKKIIIEQLVCIIYFVLYSLCISFLHDINLISTKVFSILLIIGLIVVILLVYSKSHKGMENKFLRKLDIQMRCPSDCTLKK